MQHKAAQAIVERFEHILDLIEDGLFISDRRGISLKVNKMYEKMTGLTQERVVGRHVSELVSDGIFDTVVNPEVVRTKKTVTCLQKIHGGPKVLLRGHPVFDDDGEVVLVVTFVRDITVIAQFQEQIQQQKRLIETFMERLELLQPQRGLPYVFESPAMKNLLELLERVAGTDAVILLLGETGVGKDLLARMAHDASVRKDKIFLKVDCGSISPSLIESELFGYLPGAFSGASPKGKLGYFEIADGGTVFLDEIGELPMPMQTRLLRVLQDGEVTRVGASRPNKVDVRIIAATNRDLEDDIKTGRFRNDLFYRLNVATLHVPSLRERREDIFPLAQLFLERFAIKYKKNTRFSPQVAPVLENYPWPGNVRELQNVVQNLIITRDQTLLTPSDLPQRFLGATGKNPAPLIPDRPQPLKAIMAAIERDILKNAVKTHGSIIRAAEFFQIDRTTLFRKLKGGRKQTEAAPPWK
jgi:PAS domain S-box-containing protein